MELLRDGSQDEMIEDEMDLGTDTSSNFSPRRPFEFGLKRRYLIFRLVQETFTRKVPLRPFAIYMLVVDL